MRLVHVNAADADLAEAWLHETPVGGVPPLLLGDAADAPFLAGLARRHGLRHAVLPPAPDHPEALRLRPLLGHVAEAGLVLAEPAALPLRFRPGETQPAWNDRFPAVRVMHALGVRRFTFQGHEAVLTAEIPLLPDGLRGRHAGRRAFVVGNGPSLRRLPMERLRGEVLLGANRSFLGYGDWGFAFPYWGISDRLQIEMYRDEYEAGLADDPAVKLVPFEYLGFLRLPNLCPVPMPAELPAGDALLSFPQASDTPTLLFNSFTVTIPLIQAAVLLGCNPVVLIGVDHSYPIARIGLGTEPPNPTAVMPPEALARHPRLVADLWDGSAALGPTHFTGAYTANRVFVPPRTAWSEACYAYVRAWAAARGVSVLNATPGTRLDAFPLVEFESLF
ncbi:hypothetical protein LPC08_06685 [Roseomonas sp. OT10]|uniref:hypothetical protein n=1 Tax=Roseomonas cutis TaxID=2897332 RepID=UPI001E556471|nr:hypothetical protein [Roseomonas sp. OT10]UFN50306.1 hypothetical protein LPC08_06685 [Roseomonas sp. OT10]